MRTNPSSLSLPHPSQHRRVHRRSTCGALSRVEQRRGHYRCDANALLPQLAATRSLVSHVIVPLEALGNTARWLGIPRVGHEAGMCPLGTLHP